MKTNQILAVIAAVLFVLSVWAYHSSVTQAERFERGQSFLPNLNPDEIDTIVVTKGDESVTMKRGEEEFTLATSNGYPAKNEAVNRLIRNVLEINLEKEVGSGDDLLEELDLAQAGESTTEVVFKNEAGKEMVHFLVGKSVEGGSGSYVRRLDGDRPMVYLTSKNVYLNSGASSFLKREILDVKGTELSAIKGRNFEITEQDGELKLADVPVGWEEKTSAMNRIKGVLSYLNFEEVFLGDDPQVADLQFQQYLQVNLKDQSGYSLSLANKGEDNYLQIGGFHEVSRVAVERDESEEELQEKADILSRANEIQKFNEFHGSWVYKINKSAAEKIELAKSDLMERKG